MKKTSGFKLYLRSFSYLGPFRGKYILGLLLSCCEYALLFMVPYINQQLIDIVIGEQGGDVMQTLLILLAVFLLLVPPVVIGAYLRVICAEEGVARLRKQLFRHVAHLPYSEMSKYRTGDYITRLSDDVGKSVGAFGNFSMTQLIRFAAVFPVSLILLLKNDWRIAVAGLIYGSINMVLSLYLNPKSKRQEAVAKAEIAKSASFLIEALRAIPVVRVFVMQKVLSERYRAIREVIKEKRMKYQNLIGITYGTVDFFAQSAQAVGFIIGILLSLGRGTLGETVLNATLMGMMGDSIYRLSTFLLLAQPNFVSMERVEEILNIPVEDLKSGDSNVDLSCEKAVEFCGVSFSYDGEQKVLDNISFTLHKGERLAIVGGSGGGKSTIVKLIEGFYRPNSGEIRYFGSDGSSLSLDCIRDLFSYVPQECSLFDGTIRENISLGRPSATMEEIREAAQMADIHEFISNLPKGYDAEAGEGGRELSGGQRQRIAIARGLLKNAPVLLLDEATAALDSSAEKEVQACLDKITDTMLDMGGKDALNISASLTVAHRLSTVQNSDRILVIEEGRIVEQGKFQELLDRGGRFKELYEAQQRQAEAEAFRRYTGSFAY